MAKISMEKRIDTARESLKNGGSLEVLQNELRNDLKLLIEANGYTESQIKTYETMINDLGEPVKVTNVNNKFFKGMVAGILFTLAGGSAVACSFSKSAGAIISTNFMDSSMDIDINPEENKEVNYVLPEYLNFDVNDNEIMIKNLSDFINDALSKGLFTIEEDGELKSCMTEANELKKIESIVCLYYMFNLNNIDYKNLAEANQQGNLTAQFIFDNAIAAMREIYYDAFTLTEGQELLIENIIADKNILAFAKRLDDLNVRYNGAEDDSERKEIIREAIAIKEEFVTYSASKKTEMNPFGIDFAFTRLNNLNILSNGQIITDNEADIGLFNSVLGSCITEEQRKEWGLEDVSIKSYNGDGRYSFTNTVRQASCGNVNDKMQMALDYANVNEIANVETSFNCIVSEIAKNVDLNNFKANDYGYSNWLYMVRNKTNKTVEEDLKNSEPVTVTVTKKDIPAEKVSEKDKVKDEVVSTTVRDDDGKDVETTQDYLKAKAAAIADASKDVADEYVRRGTSLTIKFKNTPSEPNKKTASYKEVYKYWYARIWNETLMEFQKAERKANKENNKTESEFIPTNPTDEPVITDQSDNYNSPKPEDEVTFIPVEEGIVIDEGIIDFSGQQNSTEKNPTPSYPTPSYPTSSTPTSSTPAPSTPAPSTPVPSTPAPSTPVPSTPAPSTPTSTEEGVTVEQGVEVNEGLLLFSSNGRSQIDELEQLRQELLESIENIDFGSRTK